MRDAIGLLERRVVAGLASAHVVRLVLGRVRVRVRVRAKAKVNVGHGWAWLGLTLGLG